MSRIGFVGGAYQSQAYSADAQVCVNLMPEKVESGAGKSEIALVGIPGLSQPVYQLPDNPVRGEWQVQTTNSSQRAFAVAGSTLFELFSDGTFLNRGAVANDGKPVSFASNNIQVMIASGGQGYCFTLATNVLTGPIATIAGVVQVKFVDGFFAALIGNSARFYISAALDGTTWDPAQTAIVSVFADNVVSMDVLGRLLCFFGKKKSVCYYNSGASPFPFEVVGGGFTAQGSAATFGIVPADNTLFGIWGEENGQAIAFRLNGNTFQRISTHPIELAWSGYSTISDAVGYTIQLSGHTIIVWYFPSAASGNGRTWGYDVATGVWFEMAFFQNDVQKAHRSWCHIFAFGKHLVGDPLSGNIYQMDFPTSDGAGGWLFADDFGNNRRWVRRAPYVGVAGVFNYFTSLEFLMDVGLGPNIPLLDGAGKARDPQAILRISKDGGHNWFEWGQLNLGQIGKFGTRVIARRLGKVWGSTGIIFELSGSDPVPIRITDADLVAEPNMPSQKRIAQELRERA